MSASAVKRKGAARSPSSSLHSINSKTGVSTSTTAVENSIIGVGAQSDLDAHASTSSTAVLKSVVAIPGTGAPPAPSACPLAGASTATIGPLRVKVEPGRCQCPRSFVCGAVFCDAFSTRQRFQESYLMFMEKV